MKFFLNFCIVFCFLFSATAFSQGNLLLKGTVFSDGEAASDVRIVVRINNKTSKTLYSGSKGDFKLTCSYNRVYKLFFSKNGHSNKQIVINTSVPFSVERRLSNDNLRVDLNGTAENYEIDGGGNLRKIKSAQAINKIAEDKKKRIEKREHERIEDSLAEIALINGNNDFKFYEQINENQEFYNSDTAFTSIILSAEEKKKNYKKKVYSPEEALKLLNDKNLLKIDTLEFSDSKKRILSIDKKEDKKLQDTLNYLNEVLNIQEELARQLRITLETEIKKSVSNRNSELIAQLQQMLIRLEQRIHIIKEEILEVRIKLKAQEAEIKEAGKRLAIAGVTIFFLLVIVIIIFFLYRDKRKHYKILTAKNHIINLQNEEIKAQNDSINEQNEILANQQKEILDSISYAGRIQAALLPSNSELDKNLQDYFLFYEPKDIVSGDFYWSHQNDKFKIIIAADCTGHGVPGAFLSVLGISYLTEIVAINNTYNAADVLNKLRKRVKDSLKQTGEVHHSKDGMDMAVCIIDKNKKVLNFAGAYNSMYLIRDKNLILYKADRQPIGIHQIEKAFTNHFVDYKAGDNFYIFSDGFADQFGAITDKRYKVRRFKTFLRNISSYDMNQQKQKVEKEFQNWKKSKEQTDDVLVIGFRL